MLVLLAVAPAIVLASGPPDDYTGARPARGVDFGELEKVVEAEKTKEKLPLAAADLVNFAGKYVNGPQTWEIVDREGKLFFKDGEGEYELTRTGAQMLSFGDKLENDVALVPGPDGKTEYIFTGLYSARRSN